MRWPAVLLATRAAAQFGVFSGDGATDCFYVYNGVNYVSGHQLEDAILGDDPSAFFPRLSRATNYDSSMRPNVWYTGTIDAPPELVAYDFSLKSFELDEKKNLMKFVGSESYSWTDPRLNFTFTDGCYLDGAIPGNWFLTPGFLKKIWQPELYTVNSVEPTRPFSPRDDVAIIPGGRVFLTYTTTKLVQCSMKFHELPDDTQDCENAVGSYPYASTSVLMYSGPMAYEIAEGEDGGSREVFSNQWRIHSSSIDIEQVDYGGLPYSEAHQRVRFKRRHKYYITEALYPALFFLIISYCGFWIDRAVAPARVAIAVIPVLIMRTLLNGTFANFQIISYSTLLTSILHLGESLCVIAVFEYAVVQVFLAREKKELARHKLLGKLKEPILHYVQMRGARADDVAGAGDVELEDRARAPSDPPKPPPLAVVAVVEKLRDAFEGVCDGEGRADARRVHRLLRGMGRPASVDDVRLMIDLLDRGATSLDFARTVEFVVTYESLAAASVAAEDRHVRDMPASERVDVAFRVGFPLLTAAITGLKVTAHKEYHNAYTEAIEDSIFNDPLFFQWVPFMGVAVVALAVYAEHYWRFHRAFPDDDK